MALNLGFARRNDFYRISHSNAFHSVVASAAKSSKGFGGARNPGDQKSKRDVRHDDDRRTFKEAAASISTRRLVRPEEAARGKLDYVQVADWGDGDRAKLGELRLVSHVQQYEGGASATEGASASGVEARAFQMQLAHQLKMAEARGALAVAGPPPPAVTEWSFREVRYSQYLADQLDVHEALEAALMEAAASANVVADSNGPDAGGRPTRTEDVSTEAAAAPLTRAQDALHALLHLTPGRLGLERSAVIRKDLAALRATANHPAVRAAGGHSGGNPELEAGRSVTPLPGPQTIASREMGISYGPSAVEPSPPLSPSVYERTAGPMARSYAQVLRRMGRVAAAGDGEKERRCGALRLLAHAAVLHMVAQAVWVRVGATATERLALLQRGAAATYHEYPPEVTDPRVSLARALEAAGEHLRNPADRQVVFDEVASAMQKTGLLLSALAHRD